MNNDYFHFIKEDIDSWGKFYGFYKRKFLHLFLRYPEFRCLLKMRLKYGEQANGSLILKALRILVALSCRGHNCFIYTEPSVIGRRLLLHHTFATMISADKIGDNCHIYQQVTIENGGWNAYYR